MRGASVNPPVASAAIPSSNVRMKMFEPNAFAVTTPDCPRMPPDQAECLVRQCGADGDHGRADGVVGQAHVLGDHHGALHDRLSGERDHDQADDECYREPQARPVVRIICVVVLVRFAGRLEPAAAHDQDHGDDVAGEDRDQDPAGGGGNRSIDRESSGQRRHPEQHVAVHACAAVRLQRPARQHAKRQRADQVRDAGADDVADRDARMAGEHARDDDHELLPLPAGGEQPHGALGRPEALGQGPEGLGELLRGPFEEDEADDDRKRRNDEIHASAFAAVDGGHPPPLSRVRTIGSIWGQKTTTATASATTSSARTTATAPRRSMS